MAKGEGEVTTRHKVTMQELADAAEVNVDMILRNLREFRKAGIAPPATRVGNREK